MKNTLEKAQIHDLLTDRALKNSQRIRFVESTMWTLSNLPFIYHEQSPLDDASKLTCFHRFGSLVVSLSRGQPEVVQAV